ncbi:primary-amine oxidase [Synechococcus sp. Nb3U1]|nr:primary-amine oxidase [Synechococcus sp. Nb3U1]
MVCELSRSRDAQVKTSLPRLPAQSETSRQPISPQQHPLDPLTPEEIQRAVAILRQQKPITPEWRFATIQLQEPDRRWMSTWKPGMDWDRQAFVVLLDRSSGSTYEAVVSLSAQQVRSWRLIPGVQPALLDDEVYECDRLLKEDAAFLAALARRGIQDVSLVMVDYWTIGYFGIPAEQGQRLVRGLCFLRSEPCDNGYARPIEGLSPWIDLNRMQVVKIEDRGLWPLPPESSNFDELFFKDFRADLKPLEIIQPQGVSFQVEGHHIRWQKWDLRISFNPREGLVLHQVGYEDQSSPDCGEQSRIRPILYRASVAEMVVPYGDPRDPHFRKNAFDVGEYAIGMQANSLQLGCDCLGEIYYFDAHLHTNSGEPMLLKNAVCMHEEDFGILWKHSDWRTERAQVRRSRRLVISFFTTVGNYDYGFFWYFYQDGTLEFEAKLTGIINTCATLPGEDPEFGTLVAPQLAGLNHQHFFTVRLDMAVDGDHNSLYEVHSQALPLGPENPHGNAFRAQATLLKTEQQAVQSVDPLQGRYWKIVNPQSRNRLGQAVGYKLLPGENVQLLAQPDSWLYRRAGYLTHHLWATPYHPEEKFPAGDYPNQHPGGEGLVNWTQANRSIENTELVLWYSFGCNHLPRPEDWPVMPVSYIGFMLKPVGFFDHNPALDVPPSPPKAKDCCGSSLN